MLMMPMLGRSDLEPGKQRTNRRMAVEVWWSRR